jgi:hypothetical protein
MNTKPLKGEFLDALLRSTKTIFSTKDIAFLWQEADERVVTNRLKQYVRVGKLIRVRRSLYAKDTNYNHFELATRINTPSYISFETVLTYTGTNFQYYGNIFIASYVGREMIIDKQVYSFVYMKDYVLSNTTGIEHVNGIAMASKERAFLDRLYVNKNYYLDNTQSLNWEKVLEILPIYHNKRMEKEVKKLYNTSAIKKIV